MPLFNPLPYATVSQVTDVTDREVVVHFGDGRAGIRS